MSQDIYSYWRAACAPGTPGDRLATLRLPTVGHGGGEDPQPGLWKVRLAKGAPAVLLQIWLTDEAGQPAAQWRDGLKLVNVCNGGELPLLELAERWLFVDAATKDEAAHWRANGRWPADPPALPPRTHNLPADPFEALKLEADDRMEQVMTWLHENSPIQDQLGCDTARNMQAALLEARKRADVMHTAEKAPVLEHAREIDSKYRFRESLADWAGKLRSAFEGWMAAEERRQQAERDRLYREERAKAEAERARIEAEQAKLLADDPIAALTSPAPEMPELPPPPEPVKIQAGGGRGRKAGLKDDWDIEVTDYKLAALQVMEDPEVSILVGKLLLRRVRAAKGRIEIPGVKITSVRRAA